MQFEDHEEFAWDAEERRDWVAATQHWRRICRDDPNDADALTQLANACYQSELYEEAGRLVEKALRTPGDHHKFAYLVKGLMQRRTSDFAGAAESFRSAIQIAPDTDFYCLLADAYANLGCLESAKDTYRLALQLSPDNEEALANLGWLLSITNAAEGIPLIRRSLEIAPDYAFAHSRLAHALSASDRKDGAVYHYREAIRCNPESMDYRVNLALELMLIRSRAADAEAESELRRAIQLDPTSALPLRIYAMFLEFRNRIADAKRLYRDAIATDPTDELAARRLARLEGS